ncbi:DUF4158 domain-containing protein [Photorhabdus stackebrandtii]|uniref:DUF4158 domain-containing protein n=1 Tax=Photorhabdus stackebrandtii TaxID=1123042 RepID=UPI001407CA77|nr:DUF4158 domain-containing protein [Photorhabdus stackebrandtii]
MENNKRIQLLSNTEVEELYSRPEFNVHEQQIYFTLTQSERVALSQFSNTKTRIYFILQLGYFKAKQQFFNFTLDDVSNDIQFITTRGSTPDNGIRLSFYACAPKQFQRVRGCIDFLG